MSKSKTKRAHRELKREKARKLAANHRKAVSAAKNTAKPLTAPPPSKKVKHSADTTTTNATTTLTTTTKHPIQASQKQEIPFGPYDNILLVGEGDFSFTKSLVLDHGCANVTATSYDSREEVRRKYPDYDEIETELTALTPPVPLHHGIDATKLSTYKALRAPIGDDDNDHDGGGGIGRDREAAGGWDTIAFMFPHTGGLSTDVNRQVRANQTLLVGFFEACLEKKASTTSTSSSNSSSPSKPNAAADTPDTPPKRRNRHPAAPFLKAGGRIIVTLFENPPYTLWNVRDLARHVGLKVRESWRFDWDEYPAYRHVRTLGAIEGGGAWKGEERSARMYVFEKVVVDGGGVGQDIKGKGKKRGRGEEESESDEG